MPQPIHSRYREGGSTYNASVVLEVKVDAIRPAPGLALANDNGGHDLFAEFGLSLLDGGHNHVTDTGSGETVKAGSNTSNGDDVQVASTGVITAVHYGTTVRQKRRPLALLFSSADAPLSRQPVQWVSFLP